jgi:hypothetical protein
MVNNPVPPKREPAALGGSLVRFFVVECKGLGLVFWQIFWRVTVGSALIIFLVLAILVFVVHSQGSPPGEPRERPPLIGLLIILFGFSLYYALWLGLLAGGAAVLWRLVGAWIIVPVIFIPATVVVSIWLSSNWLTSEGLDVLDALAKSAEVKGFPETQKAVQGMGKVIHAGGGEVLAIFLVLLSPFLVVDAFWILCDPGFLWQFVQFVLAFVLVLTLGLVPSSLLSMILLWHSFAKRLRVRCRHYLSTRGAL